MCKEALIHTMPNYYAHLTFGQRVLADLPAGLSELIEQEREAFDLGTRSLVGSVRCV